MRRVLALTPALVLACAGSSPPATETPVVVVAAAPAASSSSAWRPATVDPGVHRPSSDWRARLQECTPDETPRGLAREQFKSAVLLYNDGRYPQALEIFVQLYRQTCTAPVLYNVATTLEHVGERAAAAEVFELYLEREPSASRGAEVRSRIESLRRSP